MKVKHVAGTRIRICIDNADAESLSPAKACPWGHFLIRFYRKTM